MKHFYFTWRWLLLLALLVLGRITAHPQSMAGSTAPTTTAAVLDASTSKEVHAVNYRWDAGWIQVQ